MNVTAEHIVTTVDVDTLNDVVYAAHSEGIGYALTSGGYITAKQFEAVP